MFIEFYFNGMLCCCWIKNYYRNRTIWILSLIASSQVALKDAVCISGAATTARDVATTVQCDLSLLAPL